MNSLKLRSLFAFVFSFAFIFTSFAQSSHDVIYLKYGEKIECEIVGIEADKISYQPLERKTSIPIELYTFTLALAVKSNGEYYIPGGVDTKWIQGGNKNFDVIYSSDNKVTAASNIKVSDLIIIYDDVKAEKKDTLNKDQVAGIIYKAGSHQVFGEARQFATVLQSTLMQVISLSEVEAKSTLELDGIDYDLYSKKALKKTEDLGLYIGLITNKTTDMMDKKDAIDLAVQLFINEEAKVEVSSVNNSKEKRQYPIRKYLDRIRLLQYDKVEVKWRNISYVSKLRKGVDGNYYGVITVQQVFRGYKDGMIVYQDITQKDLEVILTTYEKQVDGVTETKWDVFLSDIGVTETKEG